MSILNVYEYLCWYDQRSDHYTGGERKEDCFCDNCFYGRTELAEKILDQEDEIDRLKSDAGIID
jgi:hypothetical protein